MTTMLRRNFAIQSFALICGIVLVCIAAATAHAESTQVDSVLLRLVEQVEVPAQEAGVLVELGVREGDSVAQGAVLGKVKDTEAVLARDRAKLEVDIARRKADNDISVRFAKKTLEVNKAELRRSAESVEKYKKSISKSEIDRLELAVQKSTLEIEQAEHDLEVNRMTQQLKETELNFATENVQRRQITAPFAGVVVQVYHQRGEWVEPGDKVLRLVRIDRLRAEGFLNAQRMPQGNLVGRPVELTLDLNGKPATFTGKVVFVSPEIDPVNGQVRVWAEFENRGQQLRPGQRAKMTIQ